MSETASLQGAKPKTAALRSMIRHPIADSDSPAYIRAKPRGVDRVYFRKAGDFIKFPRDPKAGALPRGWQQVGLLALPSDVLEEAKADHPDLRESVAYKWGDVILVKQLPEDLTFAEDPYALGTLAVGARIGPCGLSVMAGLWAPKQDFVRPPQLTRHPEGVHTIDNLPNRFPDSKVFV